LRVDIEPSAKRKTNSTCGKVEDEVGHLKIKHNIILQIVIY